jgi:uncharacterized protein
MKRHLPAKVRIARFFRSIVPAASILVFGILAILGFLIYRISYPGSVSEPVNPSYYMLPSLEVVFPAENGKEIPAWWIPGLKGAPGIVLAPGYGMSRSDALSLANVLHENGFNVLAYSQRGSSITPRGASTLGTSETGDMIQALEFVQNRPESDRARLGIWGVDIGAFAALQSTASVSEVRAIAADGAFESAFDFLDLKIDEESGVHSSLLQLGCRQLFRLVHILSIPAMNERLPLEQLSDRSILFIKGENREGLGRLTNALYNKIQPQKEMISFKSSRIHLMAGEDLKSYDTQVASFFQLNLFPK